MRKFVTQEEKTELSAFGGFDLIRFMFSKNLQSLFC